LDKHNNATGGSTMKGTLLTALLLVGANAAPAYPDELKLGYINKMGEHPWFVAEVAGAKSAATEAGVKLSTQDVQFNADLTLTTFDTMVGDGVKGIAIVVPDKALGPVVAEKAAKANIKLIAVDDDIYSQDKTMVPYIGMNAMAIGRQAGRRKRGSTRRSVGLIRRTSSLPPLRTARPTLACSARAARKRLS
jgi:L-arabinose transport system substrate-binding protein